ncbi:MAG: hypothetical protein D6736_04650, partial [Nitrospinota bacterium]
PRITDPAAPLSLPSSPWQEPRTASFISRGQRGEDLVPWTLSRPTELRVIGQLQDSFILIESPQGLLILDQHAAQERILYEKLKQGLQQKQIPQQQLLFPLPIELSLAEFLHFQRFATEIAQAGFQVEPFGEKSVIVRGVPAALGKADYARIFLDLLDRLMQFEQKPSPEEILENILTTVACHDAIKANHPLQPSQMEDLLQELLQTEAPHTCPHGRPLFLFLSGARIRTRFLR